MNYTRTENHSSAGPKQEELLMRAVLLHRSYEPTNAYQYRYKRHRDGQIQVNDIPPAEIPPEEAVRVSDGIRHRHYPDCPLSDV